MNLEFIKGQFTEAQLEQAIKDLFIAEVLDALSLKEVSLKV